MKVTQLVNHNIGVVRGKEPEETGSPKLVDTWSIVLTDMNTGDQTVVGFRADVRDAIIQQLTGGIVLANGDLSKLPKPPS